MEVLNSDLAGAGKVVIEGHYGLSRIKVRKGPDRLVGRRGWILPVAMHPRIQHLLPNPNPPLESVNSLHRLMKPIGGQAAY